MTPALVALMLSLAAAAPPEEPERRRLLSDAELGGNLKVFHVSSYPFDNDLFAAEVADGSAFLRSDYPLADDTIRAQASSFGLLTGRLTGRAVAGPVTGELHPQLTVQPGTGASTGLSLAQTGVGLPEAVDLSWEAVDDEGLQVQLRLDRANLEIEGGPVRATLGRQAVTFGHGLFFTPLDLVNPFFPTAVDQEYKPGVDAARLDAFWGMAGQATVVSAYQGSWDAAGLVHAAYAQTTVGLWDLGLFGGLVHGDGVVGVSTAGSWGPVSLHSDVAVTAPGLLLDDAPQEDVFVRAVVGASGQVTATTTVSGEAYVQTLGATDPADYLGQYASDRFARGELWLVGRTYVGLSVAQEIVPVVSGSLFAIVNVEEPSALLGPGLAWSVSDEVSANLGAYAGLGERPTPYQVEDHPDGPSAAVEAVRASSGLVRSEFGTVPLAAFASLQAYF